MNKTKDVPLKVWCRYFNKLQSEMCKIKYKHPDIFKNRGHGFRGLKFQDRLAEKKYCDYRSESEVATTMIRRLRSE
jgi:hypothetical protein